MTHFFISDLMVFPGYKTGSVQLLNLATTEQKVSSSPVTINAHQNELCCLAINQQGTMIATASVKGTLIRIWDSTQRVMLVELRRGSDPAILYCINFSIGDEWLCCSSDKGTVHVFALQDYRYVNKSTLRVYFSVYEGILFHCLVVSTKSIFLKPVN